jgi:hypothetical protein
MRVAVRADLRAHEETHPVDVVARCATSALRNPPPREYEVLGTPFDAFAAFEQALGLA